MSRPRSYSPRAPASEEALCVLLPAPRAGSAQISTFLRHRPSFASKRLYKPVVIKQNSSCFFDLSRQSARSDDLEPFATLEHRRLPMAKVTPFHESGSVTDEITVEISMQIIGLFSEGLYSSPNKAIEELVSNSFDADATTVHVLVSQDRAALDSSVVVIDNGTGMNDLGLKTHWIVGDSVKAGRRETSSGRKTIGKFGIGKLAAYVLGNRLTHISKSGGKYYSTSMDFKKIPRTADVGDAAKGKGKNKPPVTLDLRELTAAQARDALSTWLTEKNGLEEMQLFGKGASKSWTVAIISNLKPMAVELYPKRLSWVLSTAMPLRDDFNLFFNGGSVVPSKMGAKRISRWTLGRQIKSIPRPAPTDLEAETVRQFPKNNYRHWSLVDSSLGPITGYIEVYEAPIDTGKSDELIGRSNGFFVYVHGRLINPEDAGFGIDRNTLRHGTFSRFRVVVNIDRLDEELRSSREKLRDGPMLTRARELLQGTFNFARTKLQNYEDANVPERRAQQRLLESPASLTQRPVISMLMSAFDGQYEPRHLVVPSKSDFESTAALIARVEERMEDAEGLASEIAFADLGTNAPIAMLDCVTGLLNINQEHPFIAHFCDDFGDSKKNLPLQLFAISEIYLEAQMHTAQVDGESISDVLEMRDELLRHLARSSGSQSSVVVAQNLIASAISEKGLEESLVRAFKQLGFEAIPKAGKNEPDGLAEAHLSGGDGVGRYRVSLEAKSKREPGGKVKKKDVQISTVARHRDEAKCEHAIVVGPAFETGPNDTGTVVREIDNDRKANPGKTITLMDIADLARLVRIAPMKRLNLANMRSLFVDARTPSEASTWVDEIEESDVTEAPYQLILETVWQLQVEDPEHNVEFGSLRTVLRMKRNLRIKDEELRTECLALSRMAPQMFHVFSDRVDLSMRPDRVMETLQDYISSTEHELAEDGE